MSKELLKIITYPNPFLDQPCRKITPEEIKDGSADGWNLAELIERMKATMYAHEGVGLAASQARVGLRLFVADIAKDHSSFFAILNPTLSDTYGATLEEEGCLSLPQVRAKVKRFSKVTVHGVDLNGQPVAIEAAELLARVCQHECDHLNGVLFINKLGMTAKLLIRRQLIKLEEDYNN